MNRKWYALLFGSLLCLVWLCAFFTLPPFVQKEYRPVAQNAQDWSEEEDKINLNTALEAELCTLPQIGPQKAQNILEYRKVHGAFQTIEDLVLVDGISNNTLEKIKDRICV